MPVLKLKPTPNGDGGLQVVKKLPEVGNEGLLYKTPDGKIWSCTNTTETETVSDLEVGKSYELVERNLIFSEEAIRLFMALDTIGWKTSDSSTDIFFNGEGNYPRGDMSYITDPETGDTTVLTNVYTDENSYVSYEGINEAELHNLSELPSIEITQQFVTDITTAGLELMDWTFLFQNSTHTEEVVTSTWSEVGGSGGSPIEEGTGIKITGEDTKTISIDEEVVAKKEDIGNGRITITQGGTTKGTFDLNQKTGATINLDAGGGGSQGELTLYNIHYENGGTKFTLQGLAYCTNTFDNALTELYECLSQSEENRFYLVDVTGASGGDEPYLYFSGDSVDIHYNGNEYDWLYDTCSFYAHGWATHLRIKDFPNHS